ncbi:hypothetical protein NPIL_167331 [Nephila pilipes]|uniref:Uncharacterized protein n=1 Tax=Nephila pilipes TaxID=299642 RepID=A0A8X6T509_NEPPI|nr:hypothetical protein NPIL_167331 [Nephila pilipes]
MMEEPVNPHHTVTLREFRGFSVYTHGFDIAHMRRMLRIEDGGKHKRRPAFRALLVPTVDSDSNVFISAETLVFALDLVFRTLHDPREIQYPQIAEQAL